MDYCALQTVSGGNHIILNVPLIFRITQHYILFC